jgi:hypothetical protein
LNGVEWKKGKHKGDAAAGITGLPAVLNKAANGQQSASAATGLVGRNVEFSIWKV